MKKPNIAIIGGGIVGSTAAYYLIKANYPIILFDEGVGQATKAAAGIICPWLSLRRNKAWYSLVERGVEFYRQFYMDLERDSIEARRIVQIDGGLYIRMKKERI